MQKSLDFRVANIPFSTTKNKYPIECVKFITKILYNTQNNSKI
jgi:hypothetical protein